jgi:hypothetical protein
VERLSPMALLLRLAGQSLASEQKTATIRPQEAKQPGAPAQ